MYVLSLVFGYFREYLTNFSNWAKKMRISHQKLTQITFTGYESERKDSDYQNDTYPFAVRAIIHHMIQNDMMNKIKTLREISISENLCETRQLFLGFESNIEFEIAPNITGIVDRKKYRQSTTADQMGTSGFIVEFVVYSKRMNMKQLRNFVESCIREYNDHMLMEGDRRHYFFSYLGTGDNNARGGGDDDDEGYGRRRRNTTPKSKARFDECVFTTNRSFANIFFEQKQMLESKIRFFMENKAWYDERGIPYTLGLLFYGTPGCGKTSTIKAIARLTGRHIVEVHLSKIKTAREFIDIFHNETIMGKIIPMNRRLYILEDIDCMGKIIQKREKSKGSSSRASSASSASQPDVISDSDTEEQSPTDATTANTIKTIAAAISNIKTPAFTPIISPAGNDKMTLSVLLNALDGVLEMTGRMLIMTTNHPEKLDPALIRPGRIDMKIHFKKSSATVLRGMIEHFYRMQLTTEECENLAELNDKWSPAEVSEILIRNADNYRTTLEELVTNTPIVF
jgi:hypothetical protein